MWHHAVEDRSPVGADFAAYLLTALVLFAPGVVLAQSPELEWLHLMFGGEAGRPESLATDHSGGFYATGFGILSGSPDCWLARFDTGGTPVWARTFGTDGGDYAKGVASDGAGAVYVAGWTDGNLAAPNAGHIDAWIARFDSSGNQLWIRQFGTDQDDLLFALAPDGLGGIVVAGSTEGSFQASAGGCDIWIARYDAAGNQLWIRQMGTIYCDAALGLARPAFGSGIFVTGNWGNEAWLARYDLEGNRVWSRPIGAESVGWEAAYTAAADDTGGVFIAGTTSGNLGGASAGSMDNWCARFSSSGDQLWLRQFGTPEPERASALAPDGAGGVYLAGRRGPTTGLDNFRWIARCDGAGELTWYHQGSNVDEGPAYALLENGFGGVFACGHFGNVAWLEYWVQPEVWVDFGYVGYEHGTLSRPFNTLAEAHAVVPAGRTIRIRTGSAPESGTFDRQCTIEAFNGPVTIGR